MKLKSINQVISKGYCLGCGLCHVVDNNTDILEQNGNLVSGFRKSCREDHVSICPAAGYNIVSMGKEVHSAKYYSYELGWYNDICLAQSRDKTLLRRASSGGVMTTIALFMLESGLADGVICTKYSYCGKSPRPVSYVARSKEELLQAQGSKYCPTSTLIVLDHLKQDEKYVLIGTPCQIAGWRKYCKVYNPSINIVLTIANFCGGYRDYREIDHFVNTIAGFEDVVYFQHRGDGVPGQMRIVNKNGKEWKYPYPDYAHLSPFQKNKRCVFCIDATGELADFSCGDSWIDRIRQTGESWSTVILRNNKAVRVFQEIANKGLINTEKITVKEVVESQLLNITSKKYRQYKRIRIQTILLKYVPNWYGCVKDISGSYINELRIMLSKYYHAHFKKS